MPDDLLSGILYANLRSADKYTLFTDYFVDHVTDLLGVKGFIRTRSIPTTHVGNALDTSLTMLRLVYDKAWEGTEYYVNKSTDIYRDNAPDLEAATRLQYYEGNVQVFPAVDVMCVSREVQEADSYWLQPNIDYTQFVTGNEAISVYLQEVGDSQMFPCYVKQILDTGTKWLTSYIGSAALFLANVSPMSATNAITDTTTFPRYGPRYGRKLKMALNGPAENTFNNKAIPAYEAFKAVNTPLVNFNAPTVVNSFPEFEATISAWSGVPQK
jgi:hypothetical protein